MNLRNNITLSVIAILATACMLRMNNCNAGVVTPFITPDEVRVGVSGAMSGVISDIVTQDNERRAEAAKCLLEPLNTLFGTDINKFSEEITKMSTTGGFFNRFCIKVNKYGKRIIDMVAPDGYIKWALKKLGLVDTRFPHECLYNSQEYMHKFKEVGSELDIENLRKLPESVIKSCECLKEHLPEGTHKNIDYCIKKMTNMLYQIDKEKAKYYIKNFFGAINKMLNVSNKRALVIVGIPAILAAIYLHYKAACALMYLWQRTPAYARVLLTTLLTVGSIGSGIYLLS